MERVALAVAGIAWASAAWADASGTPSAPGALDAITRIAPRVALERSCVPAPPKPDGPILLFKGDESGDHSRWLRPCRFDLAARVWIDGADSGRTTPVTNAAALPIRPGVHRFEFVVDGRHHVATVRVCPGSLTRLRCFLSGDDAPVAECFAVNGADEAEDISPDETARFRERLRAPAEQCMRRYERRSLVALIELTPDGGLQRITVFDPQRHHPGLERCLREALRAVPAVCVANSPRHVPLILSYARP